MFRLTIEPFSKVTREFYHPFGFSPISGYHFGIENNFINEIVSCSNKSTEISDKSQLLETLNKTIPIDCKDATFKILGVSLAAINTILSILIIIISIKTLVYEKN